MSADLAAAFGLSTTSPTNSSPPSVAAGPLIDAPLPSPPLSVSARITKDCPICMNEAVDIVVAACSHTFCRVCLDHWVKYHSSCPLCRKGIYEELCSVDDLGPRPAQPDKDIPTWGHATSVLQPSRLHHPDVDKYQGQIASLTAKLLSPDYPDKRLTLYFLDLCEKALAEAKLKKAPKPIRW